MKMVELMVFGVLAGGVHVAALAGLPLTATRSDPTITPDPIPIAVSAGSSDLQQMVDRWQQKPTVSVAPELGPPPIDEAALRLPEEGAFQPAAMPNLPMPNALLAPLPGIDPVPPRPDVSALTAPAALAAPIQPVVQNLQSSRIDAGPDLRSQPAMQAPTASGVLPDVSAPKPPGPSLKSQAPQLTFETVNPTDLQARLPAIAAPASPQRPTLMPAPASLAGALPQISAPLALPRPQAQAPAGLSAPSLESVAALNSNAPKSGVSPTLPRSSTPSLSPATRAGSLPQVDAANPAPLPKPKPPKSFDNVSAQAPAISLRPQLRPFVGSASAFAPTSTKVRPLKRPASLKIPQKPAASKNADKAPSTSPQTQPAANRVDAQKTWANAIAAAALRNHDPKKGAHPAGAVRLTVTVSASGQLISVRVTNSSGTRALDGKALASIRETTFPAAPAGMNGASAAFAIRLEFR